MSLRKSYNGTIEKIKPFQLFLHMLLFISNVVSLTFDFGRIYHSNETASSAVPTLRGAIYLECSSNSMILGEIIQTKTLQFFNCSYILCYLFIYSFRMSLTFKTVDEILSCHYANKSSWRALFPGLVCFAVFCKISLQIFLFLANFENNKFSNKAFL